MAMRATLGLCLFLSAATSCESWREHAVRPTPQRPTVSSNTVTTGEHTLELEGGVAADFDGNLDTPLLLKWGIAENAELFVGWSPLVTVERDAENGFGFGNLALGTRVRVLDETDTTPAAAVQLYTKLPTATEGEGIGTDEVDFRIAGIADKQLGDFSTTGYYELGVLGNPVGTGTDLEHVLALAVSTPINERWNAFGELSFRNQVEGDTDVGLAIAGLAYLAHPHSIFDMGLAIGLNDDAPDVQLLVGYTHNFGGAAPRGPRRRN